MGLDVALGVVILLGAIRGWIKGFVGQAIRLGGFVACFYLADPVRELARPYVASKLSAIDPPLLDRILWWVASVVSYIVLVGVMTLGVKLMRTVPAVSKEGEVVASRRGDGFAGFWLGAVKGLVAACFLAAAFQKYDDDLFSKLPWTAKQAEGSHALDWNEKYHPADRIWTAPPVQRFVTHIQKNGLTSWAEASQEVSKSVADRVSLETNTSSSPPRMNLPAERDDPNAGPPVIDLAPDVVKDLEQIKNSLQSLPTP